MRAIYRIAKTEISTLFYSPIAWLLLIIFTFQAGFAFFNMLEGPVQYKESGMLFPNPLTFYVFRSIPFGFFNSIVNSLYLYIPLLTMGLMSREISSGSIKLLLSSPVKIYEIVLGKFTCMLIYNFLLILILGVFVVVGDFSLVAMDVKSTFSGLLGIYLLMCAYAAIGLLMSTLTPYQVVAAITTLSVLAILNFIRDVWQRNDLFRGVSYFLSLSGRTDHFIGGLISSADVCYFVIVSGAFLGFTALKLYDGRNAKPWAVKAGRYFGLTGLVLLLGFITSSPYLTGYYDMTVGKTNTLTRTTQDIIKKIKSPLTVTLYSNLNDNHFYYGLPESMNMDRDFWQPYQRFIPGIRFKYIRYYDTTANGDVFKENIGLKMQAVAEKRANAYEFNLDDFLTPQEMQQQLNLTDERHLTVRQLTAGSKKSFLRWYDEYPPYPYEAEIAASLKDLIVSPPIVAFIDGQNERSPDKLGDRSYGLSAKELTFRHALVNQGFQVETITPGYQEIPKNLAALVLADPRTPVSPIAEQEIETYLNQGGNMLIAGEPGNTGLINPLLAHLHLKLRDGIIIQQSKDFSPDYIQADYTGTTFIGSPELAGALQDGEKIIFSGAAGLSCLAGGSPYHIDTIIKTHKQDTWNKIGKFEMDTGKVSYEPANGDQHGSIPLALALTRPSGKRQQRILVAGDADFMSNRFAGDSKFANGNFILAVYKWFTYGEFPVGVERSKQKDFSARISHQTLATFRTLLLGVVPFTLVLLAAALLVYRNRM
jgi:ABC-2 type transport system permease protein